MRKKNSGGSTAAGGEQPGRDSSKIRALLKPCVKVVVVVVPVLD